MVKTLDDINMSYAFPEVAFDEDYILATYQCNVPTSDIEKLALAIADEQTTGTWIKVSHETDDKKKKFGGKITAIYELPDTGNDMVVPQAPPMHIIQIAYPKANMGTSFPMILSTLFGNISASGPIKLIDVAFPKSYLAEFTGPKFGVEGIRDVLGVKDRPLVNAMIKPNTGWTPEEGADLFYQASKGGVDIIKDDELMPCNESFCPQKDRVKLFMEKEKQVFEETGEHTLYATNVTDRIDKVRDNAYRAIEYGANAIMINTYTSGFGTLQMLSEDPNINVPILAHIDFAGVYCGSTYTGMSAPLTIGKFVRLAGGDMQINGHPWGKFPFPMKTLSRCFRFFTQPWWNIKPMLYLVSGGTNQMMVDKAINALGPDIVLAAGGAIHGHPEGSEAGAKSMRQAIDAAMQGIPVAEYAKTHKELAQMAQMLGATVNFDLMK